MIDAVFNWLGPWTDPILLVIRYALVGTTVAGFLVWVGKQFVENWLSTKFKERLQSLQFEQSKETERLKGQINQEVEHLKGRINAQADRRLRLHQYEFETLPRLWQLIDKAFIKTAHAIVSFEKIPILDNDEAKLKKYAERCNYSEAETEFLIDAQDKIKAISQISRFRRNNSANAAVWKLRRYNAKNGIFWQKEIRDAVDELTAEINEIMVYVEMEDKREVGAEPIKRHYELVRSFTDSSRARLTPLQTMIITRLNANVISPDQTGEASQKAD
ncbi:hypothetical protein M2323_001596 [Rhodoblastus acidophilus]|uniref:hypothetical protein n=1 Tax=Rhodoblastus acidophilus TaxID=1074 RepID=UPI002223F3BE|nr:hypothetical protein [Rhodoblastus acidophilus]MCW2283983.1 hypothetical protein [Rhodoblastus acidophilus]MCW2332679.1 hypothetical protein [Rhodoblastus acidophilus]